MPIEINTVRKIGWGALFWGFLVISYSGFFAYGAEKAWFMSFGNSILNGCILFLLIILIQDLRMYIGIWLDFRDGKL